MIVKLIYDVKNKAAVFSIFKDFKTVKYIFLNLLFSLIFKFITTLPLFVVKNTNYIFKSLLYFLGYKRENFKAFYSNFTFNLMISYNNIHLKIKNHKIIFEGDKIYTNPKPELAHAEKLYLFLLKNISEKVNYNVAHNDLSYLSQQVFCRYNTSKPMLISSLNLDDYETINTALISPNNVNVYSFHNEIKEKYLLRSEEFFDRINKNNCWNISGYKEYLDFLNFLDKQAAKEFDSFDPETNNFFSDEEKIGLKVLLKPHIVKKNNQILIDKKLPENSSNNDDIDVATENKNLFSNSIFLNWNKPLITYNMVDGNNVICKLEDYTMREYFLENNYKYDIALKNTLESIEMFYQSNPELFLTENENNLQNFVNNFEVINTKTTKTIFNLTKKFEDSAHNQHDGIDATPIIDEFKDWLEKKINQ